jgi:hypothetical protein
MVKLTKAIAYRPHMVGVYFVSVSGLLAWTNEDARISRLGVCETHVIIRGNDLLVGRRPLSSSATMTSLLKHRDMEWGRVANTIARSREPLTADQVVIGEEGRLFRSVSST